MSDYYIEQPPATESNEDNTELYLFLFLGTAIVAMVLWVVCQNRNRLNNSYQEETPTTLPPGASCNPVQPRKNVVEL